MQSSRIRLYLLLTIIVSSLIVYSCSTDDNSKINGYWKLTNIQLPDQTNIAIDSQFYAFQEKYVFSFTRLIKSSEANISYGYADYPEDGKVRIVMDSNHLEESDFESVTYWKTLQPTFTIYKSTSSQLILEKGDTLFILKKY